MAAYTADNVASWLLDLRPNILFVLKKHSGYGTEDLRYATFDTLRAISEHLIIINRMFSAFEKGIVDDETARKIFGFSIKDPNYAGTIETMGKYEKILFAAIVNFNVEVFCKVILQGLRRRDPPNGFYDVIKELINELGVPEAESKRRYLNTIASIRNALHSGGFHTNRSIPPYQIDSYRYEFSEGRPVECASWPHLIAAFKQIISVLDEIANHPRVQDLGILPRQYRPLRS